MLLAEAPPRASSGWIVDARFDQAFLVGAWLVPFALWAVWVWHSPALAVLLFALIDGAHVTATFPLSLTDRPTMRQAGLKYLFALAALCGIAVEAVQLGGMVLTVWISLFMYWGAWHLIRQHYGFLRLYQARERGMSREVARWQVACLYSGGAWMWLAMLVRGWGYDPMSRNFFIWQPPHWSPRVAETVFIGCLVGLFGALCSAWGNHVPVGRRVFWFGLLALSNIYVGNLVAGQTFFSLALLFTTSYHDVQYLWIAWFVLDRRAPRNENLLGPLLRSWPRYALLVGAGSVLYMVGKCFIPVPLDDNAMRYVYALTFAVVHAHYVFDAWMWKLSQNPRLRQDLAL